MPLRRLVDKFELDFLAGVFGKIDLHFGPAVLGGFGADGLFQQFPAVGFDDQVPIALGMVTDNKL